MTENDTLDLKELNTAISSGIIDIAYVREKNEMNRREKILKNHPYSVWQGKDGKWYTYLPDDKRPNGRLLKKRTTEDGIKIVILDFYSGIETEKSKKELEESKEINKFRNSFDAWVEKQISYGVSSNTVSKYQCDYKRYFARTEFEEKDVREMNEEYITAFMIERIRTLNLKERAGKSLMGYITGVFHSALVNKRITSDPCLFIDKKLFRKFYNKKEKPLEMRIVNSKDMSVLLSRITQDHEEKPYYMPVYAVELAVYTGMRAGELAGLKWEDINYDSKVMYIRRSEKYDRLEKKYFISDTKTGKERQFPLSEELIDFFRNLRKVQITYGYTNEFVFAGADGKINVRTISDCARNKCIQTGIDVKSIHALRRTFNSKMRCEGVSVTVAASLLGHTEEVNQSNYTYDVTGMDYKREIVQKINKSTTKIG